MMTTKGSLSDVTHKQEHLDLLDDMGTLTTPLLARRFKISFDKARKIMKSIFETHENLVQPSENKIFVKGRERDFLKLDEFERYKKKRNRLIDDYETGLKKMSTSWEG